jgi:hypothetical protein
MSRPSSLDDPDYARFAWSRYWMLMRWMAGFTGLCVVAVLGFLYWQHGMVSIHLYIATAGGVSLSVMLAAALMGLVFLSNGSGHDDVIDNYDSDDWSDSSN